MKAKLNVMRSLAALLCLGGAMCLTGCTASEEDAFTQALDAFGSMIVNRANVDQTKRDVKQLPATAPGVAETRRLYDTAHNSLGRYLDLREAGVSASQSRSIVGTRTEDVQRDMMNFMSQAVVTLEPGTDTRALQLDRLPVIPPNLDHVLKKMKKSQRAELFKKFDKEIRLQPWDTE